MARKALVASYQVSESSKSPRASRYLLLTCLLTNLLTYAAYQPEGASDVVMLVGGSTSGQWKK